MKMWEHTRDSREDLAFTCFVVHEEELNSIVDKICSGELATSRNRLKSALAFPVTSPCKTYLIFL